MLPGVDEEAVEAAEERRRGARGEQDRGAAAGSRAMVGMKVAAEKKMPTANSLGRRWARAAGVDQDEVADEQASEDEIEADGGEGELREQRARVMEQRTMTARKARRWRWWKRWRGSRLVAWSGSAG